MGSALRFGFYGFDDDFFDLVVGELSWSARAWFVEKRVDTALDEPLAPLVDSDLAGPQLCRYIAVSEAIGRREHNLCSQSQVTINSDASREPLEFSALRIRYDERCPGSSLSTHASVNHSTDLN